MVPFITGRPRIHSGWRIVLAASVSILTLIALPTAPTRAARPIRNVTLVVPANAGWVDTGLYVIANQDIMSIRATGSWSPGTLTAPSGPWGNNQPWADNYFNLHDLGVCGGCATTDKPYWAALIGYIGYKPPAPGSYTSTSIYPQAIRVFLVGGHLVVGSKISGPLWLAMNDDAYSGNTADNSGQMTVYAHVS